MPAVACPWSSLSALPHARSPEDDEGERPAVDDERIVTVRRAAEHAPVAGGATRHVGQSPGSPESLHPASALRATARDNAARAGIAADIRNADLSKALSPGERFPLVIADPPYLPSSEVDRFDDPASTVDGGDDGSLRGASQQRQ